MTEPTEVDPATSVVLNALSEVVGEQGGILADESSYDVVEDAYEAALDDDRRAAFADAVGNAQAAVAGGGVEDAAGESTMIEVAETVRGELARQGAELELEHVATLELQRRDVILHRFMVAGDRDGLLHLAMPDEAREHVTDGADAVEDGDFEAAADAFERAADAAEPREGALATRVLAGWAAHRNGEDDRAIDFVEEATHLDTRAWSATCVGLAADHRFPEKFRTGKLGARFVLRATVEAPEGGRADVAVGAPGEDFAALEWRRLDDAYCVPLVPAGHESEIHLRVRGPADGFPALLGYYVSLGVVDLEVDETRHVERMFLNGPETDEDVPVREQLTVRR